MGSYIYQRDCDFTIRKENFQTLIETISKRFPQRFDAMDSVRDIFRSFRFNVEADEEGNLVGLEFIGEKSSYEEDEFFETIAPYVEAGSYISFDGDNESIWMYQFDGKSCREESPLFVWPENPKPLKEGQAFYRLPFAVEGALMIPAGSLAEAKEAAKWVHQIDLLSRFRTLLEENKTQAYLQMDKLEQVEG